MLTSKIEEHYYQPDLYKNIVKALQAKGVDVASVTRKDIAGVDEFHVRGAEVSRELANSAGIKNATVLDVGCGIGGPCRMLADEFKCSTTGIDLSKEYVKTANELSNLVGLSKSTDFIQGDATNLPFQNKSFEVVWTQHVQMNISDKRKFYSEIDRVLAAKGTFIYYDIFKKGNEDVTYPMPWANNSTISFLENVSVMESILDTLGFRKERSVDQTDHGIVFFERAVKRIAEVGIPTLGLNLVMGANMKDKIENLLDGLKAGKIHLQSGIYKK